MMEKDFYSPVQDTNDSSTVSKLSISKKGYVVDPFIDKFVSVSANRAPLINRGYYVRSKAIHHALITFIHETNPEVKRQIISLGAGFDTSYFRLCESDHMKNVKYIEVDFPRVVACKVEKMVNCDAFRPYIDDAIMKNGIFESKSYVMIGCDLTDVPLLQKLLENVKIDYLQPTLFLSECVLTYIAPINVNAILRWSSTNFPNSLFCVYEQVYPHDGFGLVMLRHFQKLLSPLMNIETYSSPENQEQRFNDLGWNFTISCSMNDFYRSLPLMERERVENLEIFDEYEELELKCSHYRLVCAACGTCSKVAKSIIPFSVHKTTQYPFELRCDVETVTLHSNLINTCRYGHASVKINEDSVIMIGGFGIDYDNCHRRLASVLQISNASNTWTAKMLPTTGNGPGPIIHHKTTLLHDGNIVVSGGRASPLNPSKNIYLLHITDVGTWTMINNDMRPRWRHTATLIEYSGEQCIIIIGGLSASNMVCDDMYIIHTKKWNIEKIPITLPEGLHSHTAISTQSGILVIGGLTHGMEHVNCNYYICFCDGIWTLAKINQPLISGWYSMASYVSGSGSKAYIFGGVRNDFGVYMSELGLKNFTSKTYSLKFKKDMCILYHGITVHEIHDQVVLYGGGGNCFSFGTHFNNCPFILKFIL